MRRTYRNITLTLILVTLLAGVVWLVRAYRSNMALQEELVLWADAGGKSDARQLAMPAAADHVNAAQIYAQAYQAMPEMTLDEQTVLRKPWLAPPAQLAKLMLRMHDVVLLIERGEDRQECVWPVAYGNANATHREHLQQVRLLVDVLLAQSVLHAMAGDTQQAGKLLETAINVSGDLATDVQFITMTVQRQTDMQIIEACEYLYRAGGIPPEGLIATLNQRNYRAEACDSLMAEGAVWLTQAGAADSVKQSSRLMAWNASLQDETVVYLRSIRNAAAYFSHPYYEQPSRKTFTDPPVWAMLLVQVISDPNQLNMNIAEIEARAVLADVAVRLRQFKNAHGNYPDALSQLDDVPADPISGGSFAYEREGEGFVLCSISVSSSGTPIQWRWER